MSYDDRSRVAGKIDWEGGVYAWATGYGFDPDDMPDEELKEAAVKMKAHLDMADYYVRRFKSLLPEVEDY